MLSAVSVAFVVLVGVGWAPCARVLRGRGVDLRTVGVAAAVGLGACTAVGMLSPSLRVVAVWGWPLALPGLWLLVREARARPPSLPPRDLAGVVVALTLALVFVVRVFNEPLRAWDARSVWFFHAKIAFFADRVLTDAYLDPMIEWSHPFYPKLNAFWAAAFCAARGTWNEFLPKASVWFLFMPAMLLALGFSRSPTTRLLLLAILFVKPEEYLWNGYMDALLAAYAAIAVLYGQRWVVQRDPVDAAAVVAAGGVCAGLKNEGVVLVGLVVLFVGLGAFLASPRRTPLRERLASLRAAGVVPVAVAAFAPLLIWTVWRKVVGLGSSWSGEGTAWSRASARLFDGTSLDAIWTPLFPVDERGPFYAWLVVLAAYAAAGFRRSPPRWWLHLVPVVGVASAYVLALFVVYLTTPYDLRWHLDTSVSRTILSLWAVVLVGGLAPLVVPRRGSA